MSKSLDKSLESSFAPLIERMIRYKVWRIRAGSRNSDSRCTILLMEEAGIERRVWRAERMVVVHSASATRVGMGLCLIISRPEYRIERGDYARDFLVHTLRKPL